jgi:hypothetical protein
MQNNAHAFQGKRLLNFYVHLIFDIVKQGNVAINQNISYSQRRKVKTYLMNRIS